MPLFIRNLLIFATAALLVACEPAASFDGAANEKKPASTLPASTASAAPSPSVNGGELERVARQTLRDIQLNSINEEREYCGLLYVNAAGDIVPTQPRRGSNDSCDIFYGDARGRVVGDYHTHSNYSPDALSEVPSDTDMEGNRADGVPGFVSTPGGRFWFVAADGSYAELICGVGCLPQDPNFVDEVGRWRVEDYYSYREIVRYMNQ